MTTGERVAFLLMVAFVAGTFAAAVWLVASVTPASLATRWECTGIAFGVSFLALLVVLSCVNISSSISQDEEGR